jgi:hypothetical protein
MEAIQGGDKYQSVGESTEPLVWCGRAKTVRDCTRRHGVAAIPTRSGNAGMEFLLRLGFLQGLLDGELEGRIDDNRTHVEL